MTEAQTIQWLNSRKNSTAKLRLVNDPYSTYDAEDSERIVEIKNRNKYYAEKTIECSKLFANYQKSQLKNKTFLYVVIDTKGLYVFNISDIIGMITVQPPVAIQMPRTTAFKKKRKIIKYVYNLAEKLCCYYAARIDE
tara:strand:- start:2453 stop:2866 length:414 start_codon:yes stop_codon:yes gene_type:complete